MGLDVDITRLPDNMSEYYDLGVELAECRKADRSSRILSAGIISAMGLLQIIEYADQYGEAIDYRQSVQDKLYQCMMADHDYWKSTSFAHTVSSYQYALAIDDKERSYLLNSLTHDGELVPTAIGSDMGLESTGCEPCYSECRNELNIERKGAMLNGYSSLARSNERIYESRVDLKMQALQAFERSSRNYSTVGRAAMTQSLSIANSLTAIAANGLNAGITTLGNGLTKLISEY